MKIILERDKCIGCGTCTVLCPKFFEMAEDGKATLKGSKKNEETGNFKLEVRDLECIKEAIESCPVQIIKVESK